jgi:D-alanine transaminase
MTQTVYLNGAFLPKAEARISPDDRGFVFADGVYEVLRSYGGTFFGEEPHLRRLRDGLRALEIGGVDAGSLGDVARDLLERNDLQDQDATVYVQVTRGAAPRVHAFPDPTPPPTVYVAANTFVAKHDPDRGVRVITTPDIRWARCDIKSVSLLPNCLASQRAAAAGAQEAIFVRDRVALEGTHTSFFAVVDGTVRTAPRSNYILPSVTRAALLQLCAEHDIPCDESPIFVHELDGASELFLAGTTMEVMPIGAVDGQPVGAGTAGPVARRLLQLFRACTG